jgi:squalene-hopene/tetraprenyl-beta-curcumene cyclase
MRQTIKRAVLTAAVLGLTCAAAPLALADEPAKQAAGASATTTSNPATADAIRKAQAAITKGEDYLQKQQRPDGGWGDEKSPPAVTALAVTALVGGDRYDAKTPFVRKGYDKLLSYQLEDGGIYKDLQANYNTSIAISALAAADEPAFKPRIDRAVAYLKQLQFMPGSVGPKQEKVEAGGERENWIGGAGYGGSSRPDLSNTQVYLEALHDAGLKESDPAFQAAVKFVSRSQNRSESNDQPWAGDDGGFVYTPANGGTSMAGELKGPDGRRLLRSYGSMTYAGLKSMIYAGLTKNDPRVKAAWDWVTKNWTLDENPGMRANKPDTAQFGLYYYFLTLARAHNAYDQPTFTGPDGKTHDWRLELIDKLATLQKPDGSWSGEKRFMEDNPALVTSYALLALNEAVEDLRQHPAAGSPGQ